MSLRMRKAEEVDGEWLFELYRTTMKDYVEKTWGWDERAQRDGLFNHLGVNNFVICSTGSEVAGCFCLKDEGEHYWLHLVLIRPSLQSRGLGRVIMEHIQSIANVAGKGIQFCTLKVNPATDFYRHLGYLQYKEDEACFYFSQSP